MKPLRSKRMERTFVVEIQPTGCTDPCDCGAKACDRRDDSSTMGALLSDRIRGSKACRDGPMVEVVRFGVASLAVGHHAGRLYCDGIGARL